MTINFADVAVTLVGGLIGLIFLRPEDQRARFAGYGLPLNLPDDLSVAVRVGTRGQDYQLRERPCPI